MITINTPSFFGKQASLSKNYWKLDRFEMRELFSVRGFTLPPSAELSLGPSIPALQCHGCKGARRRVSQNVAACVHSENPKRFLKGGPSNLPATTCERGFRYIVVKHVPRKYQVLYALM